MVALSYHTVRDSLAAEIALADGARTFLNGPNIAALTVDVELDNGAPVARTGLDIWWRQQGVLPLAGSPIGSAQAQLVAGVLGQVAEHFVIETNADPKTPAAATDVGAVFEAAASQGIETRVLHGSMPGTLPYGPMASRLIRDAVTSGDVVIVPSEPVSLAGGERVGWWRVDPRTGITRDVMDDGAGQSMGEYVVIVDEDLGTLICHGLYARRVAFLIYVAALALGAYGYTDIFWRYEDGYQGLQCSAG